MLPVEAGGGQNKTVAPHETTQNTLASETLLVPFCVSVSLLGFCFCLQRSTMICQNLYHTEAQTVTKITKNQFAQCDMQ